MIGGLHQEPVFGAATVMSKVARLAGEVLASAAHLGLHSMPLPLVYSMGGSLNPIDDYRPLYYALIGAGYLVGFVTLSVSAARGRSVFGQTTPGRVQFDLWLGAFPCAVVLVAALIYFRLPIRLRGWDGHGFGASGGEANSLLLPWLHYAVWLLLLRRRRDKPANSSSGTSAEEPS